MPTLKLWRLPFMARSVAGFLASSFNLAPNTSLRRTTREPAEKSDDTQPALADMLGPLPYPPWPVPPGLHRMPGVHRAPLRERRALDRGSQALNISGPATWRRRHSSTSITEYFTRNLKAGVASFVVPPPVDYIGTAEAFQQGMVRRVSEGMPVTEGSSRTGTAGSFDFISFEMKPPWGAPRRVVLYTVLWAGKAQVLLFGADCDEMFEANVLVAHALVQRIHVPSPQRVHPLTAHSPAFAAGQR